MKSTWGYSAHYGCHSFRGRRGRRCHANHVRPSELAQTIPLPTEGYMDHMTVDIKGQRLFLCGENSYSLVVVDLRVARSFIVTKGLPAMPKKPFYLPRPTKSG